MFQLRSIFRRRAFQDDLREEIEAHIAERVEVLLEQGVPADEARRQARRAFGNSTLVSERSMDVWQFRRIESLWADLRGGLRQLVKAPGYTATVALTLALGIGANAAIFTVIDDAMLRSLPVERPKELVELGYRSPADPRFIDVQLYPIFQRLAGELKSASDLAGWTGGMVTFPDDANTLRSIGADMVTGNALAMLGVKPAMGRLLEASDDVPGGPVGGWAVVIDYGFWLSNFRGDPAIVGKHLQITGQPAVVVGVLPPDFSGIFVGQPQKVFLPVHFLSAIAPTPDQDPFRYPERFGLQAIARLRPGSTLAELNAELAAKSTPAMKALLPARMAESPMFRDAHLAAQSAARGFSSIALRYAQPLFLIQGIAGAVLLLCCLNLAGLQAARLQARRQEFALRSTLGASRWRIAQQCLVESLMLAVLGGACAVALAWTSLRPLTEFFTPPGWGDPIVLRPDMHILAIASALAVVTTVLFGFLPALFAVRIPPLALLRAKGAGTRRDTLRSRILIPAQFALAVALVFAAGLFTHTLKQLRDTPLGFDPQHVTGVTAQFQSLKTSPEAILALYHRMIGDLRNTPGMQSAAYTWFTPVTGDSPAITVYGAAHTNEEHQFKWNDVSDGYFTTMGSRIVAGREFGSGDRDRSVCIINEVAARMLFASGSAVDNVLHAREPEDVRTKFTTLCRIVGVVEDARYASLKEAAPPTVYFPISVSTLDGGTNNLVFLMKSQTEAEAINAYRAALGREAPTTGYMTFFTLTHQIDQSLGSERLIAGLSSAFAGMALLLSGVGLFGLLALRVNQRLPEIGLRLAVGATRGNILTMVFREALLLVALGTVAGSVLIAATSAIMKRFLFATSPAQFGVVVGSLAVLGAVALLAAFVPARRAAWLDPADVLRAE